MNALLLLQVSDHRKQVARLGITFWPKHMHETLARFAEDLREFLVPDRRIDIVAQHRLTGVDITGEQTFAPFLQQALRKAGSLWARACMVSLKSFVKAIMSPLAVLVEQTVSGHCHSPQRVVESARSSRQCSLTQPVLSCESRYPPAAGPDSESRWEDPMAARAESLPVCLRRPMEEYED